VRSLSKGASSGCTYDSKKKREGVNIGSNTLQIYHKKRGSKAWVEKSLKKAFKRFAINDGGGRGKNRMETETYLLDQKSKGGVLSTPQ